jgi:hypothetical protein
MSWTYGRKRWSRIGSLCRLLREPQDPPVHGLNFLCSRRCTAETHPACPRSYPQDRRAWAQPLCDTLARTRCSSATLSACYDAFWVGLPPPPAERPRMHLRTRQSNSTWTSAFASPRHTRPLCLRQGHGLLAPGHLQILHEQFAVPPDLVCCFLLNGLRRPPRAVPLLPCGSARSRPTAAPPASRATSLHTDPVAA